MCHREIALYGGRLVLPLVGSRRVLVLEPGGDDGEPAAHGFLEGMVGIGRVLGEEVADRVRIVGLPRPNVDSKPGGDRVFGQRHNAVESKPAERTGSSDRPRAWPAV